MKYILIAGVNGAGKSTLYQILDSLSTMERVNTDEIVRTFGDWRNEKDVINAGKIAIKKIREYFSKGISFNQETTLCGNAILRNIRKAKKLGYEIEVHYVGVETIEIAKNRIAYRVLHGGHGIPDKDVERRFFESFSHLKLILALCDTVFLYDNSNSFKNFAIYKDSKFVIVSDDIPQWFNKYIK